MRRLIQELKRRNVIRVAIAYAVTAWFLIQVSETVFPMLKLPEWTATFVAVLLMIGFPIALIFAWAYELTPEGIKLEKHVVRTESITHLTGRKLDFAIIAMLVVALGYFSYDKFLLGPGREAELVQTTAEVVTEQAAETGKSGIPEQSIAVLPFVNMSSDPEQDYFSDGISEELLNVLSKIPGLRVAARTSSFQFKGENQDIIGIGQKLNTALVLEGSVRKAGLQIRITAQLVDARNGFHLWSETYDRELENIFAVQDEVSAAIVEALKEHLGLQIEVVPRVMAAANSEAHDAYLRGRHLLVQRTRTTVEGAVREFEKAILRDPDYALAYAELAIANVFLSAYGGLTVTEAVAKAAPLAEHAIALDPTLAEAHAAAGYLLRFQGNAKEAAPHFKRAIQINPNYSLIYNALGVVNDLRGEYDEAFAAFGTALRLDPLSSVIIANNVYQLAIRGRFVEADRELEKLVSMDPRRHARTRGYHRSRGGKWANVVFGHLDALRLSSETVRAGNRLTWPFAVLGLEKEALNISENSPPFVLSHLGRHRDAVTAAKARSAEDPENLTARRDLGLVLAGAGDYAHARPILEEIWQRSDYRVTSVGLIEIYSTAALVATRSGDGKEAEIGELVAAIRDNVRRYREAGIIVGDLNFSVEFEEGLAAYLAGERERGLALMAKAAEDGYFIPQSQAYLHTLYDDPGFAPIRATQEALQSRERQGFLAIVCTDNPYATVWQPAEGTCERFATVGGN